MREDEMLGILEIRKSILGYLENLEDFSGIYNEFSFQHELGFHLRKDFKNYKVEFERNINFFGENINKEDFIKKEIDIVIYSLDKKEKYAIELKHPLNGQRPDQMYSFVKDLRFVEQLRDNGFNGGISLVLVNDKLFYSGCPRDGIYPYFRNDKKLSGKINKHTGKDKDTECIELKNSYSIKWKSLREPEYKYYMLDSLKK